MSRFGKVFTTMTMDGWLGVVVMTLFGVGFAATMITTPSQPSKIIVVKTFPNLLML